MDGAGGSAGCRLNMAHRHCQGWAVVEVGGPLESPSAVRLAESIPVSATAILVDLTTVASVDQAGERLRSRLPSTAGLQSVFASVEDAVGSSIATSEPPLWPLLATLNPEAVSGPAVQLQPESHVMDTTRFSPDGNSESHQRIESGPYTAWQCHA